MRKLGILFLSVASILLAGCDKDEPDGLWPPIKLDKSSITFSAQGGQETVSMKNYSFWWINAGYEGMENINGEWVYNNVATPECSEEYNYDILDGGWYQAVVPNNGRSNQLVVTVQANSTGVERKATIAMEAGDAFTTIQISQSR